jgi:hypothetical protein
MILHGGDLLMGLMGTQIECLEVPENAFPCQGLSPVPYLSLSGDKDLFTGEIASDAVAKRMTKNLSANAS